jgi:hypothetical protein
MAGILGMALARSVEGLGQAGEAVGLQAQKQLGELDLDKERQAAIAAREETLARLQSSLKMETAQPLADIETAGKIKVAQNTPRLVPEGVTERMPGVSDFTAPKTAVPEAPGQVELRAAQSKNYEALTKRWNAEADAISEGLKYGKAQKPVMPKISVEKDADGNPYMVDQNTGAIGVIRPGAPAKPEVGHWFSANEPATPAGAPRVDWNLNGQPLANGLSDAYPEIAGKLRGAVPAAGSAGAPPAAAIERLKANADNPKARTDFDAVFGAGKADAILNAPTATPAAPKTPARPAALVTPRMAQPAQPDIPAGTDVDAARNAVSAARAKLQTYGTLKAKQDPAGFEQAKRDLEDAQGKADQALQAYQQALSAPTGAVIGSIRNR